MAFVLPLFIAILVAFVPGIAYVLITRAIAGRRARGSSVVICGPSGTGKTRLFLNLVSQTPPPSITSGTINVAPMREHAHIRIVDVPGSAQVRDSFFAEVIVLARSLLLLVDVARLDTLYQDIAFIISIFTEAAKRRLPVLIVLKCPSSSEGLASKRTAVVNTISAELQKAAGRVLRLDIGEDETDEESVLKRNVRVLLGTLGVEEDATELTFDRLASLIGLEMVVDGEIEKIKRWIVAN